MGPRRGCHLVWNTARNARGTVSVCRKTTSAQKHAPLRHGGAALYCYAMKLGNVARVVAVLAACVAAVGSATSTSNNQPQAQQPQVGQSSPPPAQQMEATR